MPYMGRKMFSNSLYYIKAQNKYMTYQNRGKRSENLVNIPEIVSFKYQKTHKMSAVSKWAMLRPDIERYLKCFYVIKLHFVTTI